MQVAKVAKIK